MNLTRTSSGAGDVVQRMECLPNMREALGSIPCTPLAGHGGTHLWFQHQGAGTRRVQPGLCIKLSQAKAGDSLKSSLPPLGSGSVFRAAALWPTPMLSGLSAFFLALYSLNRHAYVCIKM